jgi:hypothetical protein
VSGTGWALVDVALLVLFVVLLAGLTLAGRAYDRAHRPPDWNDQDFIWAEEAGMTIPESETTP